MKMPVDLSDEKQREEFRKIIREAIDAWLDKQFSAFGRWTFWGIVSAAIAAFSYAYFQTKGMKN